LKGTGFVVPRREQMRLRAVSWVSSKWAGRAPEGKVLLRAYLGGVADPSAVDERDETLAHTAHRELATLLGITDRPEMFRVYRWRNVTPQLEVGHHVLMARIDQRLSAIPSLGISASGFRGTGIADCIADARLQARRLASQLSVALTA
jgi:protoporphyrinogen/coproporphyrinogen III oxidase